MSLQSQIYSLVERVAQKFGAIDARIGALDQLDTNSKLDLVTAINEVAASASSNSSTGTTVPSSSGVAYTHVQASPASVWTVSHNLGVRPTVSLVDTGGNEVQADIVHTSANQLLIRFALPVAGMARLT
jgi:hypothetical protein